MKGSIVARGNSYRVMVSGFENGQRHQITRTAHSKKEAERVKRELLTRLDNGILSEPKGTLAEYLARWQRDYVAANLSPTTACGYQYVIRTHITPAIGNLPLKNLRPETLQKYYAEKLHRLSSTSVRHHHSLLRRAFKQAVQWGLLPRNPADNVSPPRYRKVEMRVLGEDDIHRVLDASNSHYPLFFLALYTGLRRGELLALRWQDVDLTMAEINVNRSIIPLPGGKFAFKDTKTAKGRRNVAISPNTCQVLRQHLDAEMALCARFGVKFSNDRLLFCHYDGTPLRSNSVSGEWRKLVRKLGLRGVRFHDTRHTMATAMLRAGVHPKIVQERLGHSSIAVTLDTYSHIVPGLQRAAANKLDDIYSASVTNPLPSPLFIDNFEAKV